MDDFVVFLRDVFMADNHSNIVFKKGKDYQILSEDKDSLYIQSKLRSNECSQIPKDTEGWLFEYK